MKRIACLLVVSLLIGCGGGGGDGGVTPTPTPTPTPDVVTIVPLHTLSYDNVQAAVQVQPFARQLPATGGNPPYTWRLVSGTLPPGLNLSDKGLISGTPTSTGSFTYTLRLTDSEGTWVENTYTQNVFATAGTISFVLQVSQIPEFGQNQHVGFTPFVQGGTLPWTFTITGLPNGVTYDPTTGIISGTPTSAFAGDITIILKDANGNEATGSPVTTFFQVNAPQPSGGGGGTVGCPSVYDGTYLGQFVYVYYNKGADGNYLPVQGSFQLTLTLKCTATAIGTTVLQVTSANCSDPNFGCQVSGCTPLFGSVATLPASPPTTPFNSSQSGQGLVIFFPNGASILTQNSAGALNVTTGGRILSNSLDPSIKNNTWVGDGGNFPSSSVPPGGPVTQFKSWSLVQSAL
jgi:Putative Ig domain